MEHTACIFNIQSTSCSGPKRLQITHLICSKHLKRFLGLELTHHKCETETNYQYVGGFLRPVEGHIIKENTIIIPEQKMFDAFYHNKKNGGLITDRNYTMNQYLENFIRLSANEKGTSNADLFAIETIRNLSNDTKFTNIHASETRNAASSNALALINSKSIITETKIENEEIWGYIQNIVMLNKNNKDHIPMKEITPRLAYLLSKCEYSFHLGSNPIDPIHHNAIYLKGVGLVSTEDINPPHTIRIFGCDSETDAYLDEYVNSVPKTIINKRVSLADIPEPYSKKLLLEGSGKRQCMFG